MGPIELTIPRHEDRCSMPPPQERQQNDQIVQSTVQVGGLTPKAGGRELDGRTWDEFPSPAPVAVGAGRVEAL